MTRPSEVDSSLRAEVTEVVYRELGGMVNRDYLIDALMSVIDAERAQHFLQAAELVSSSSWAEQELMYVAARAGSLKAKDWCAEQGWYGPSDTTATPPEDPR